MKRSRSIEDLEKSEKLSKLENEKAEEVNNNGAETIADDDIEEDYEKEVENDEEEEQTITEEMVSSTYNELQKLDPLDKTYEILKNRYIQEFEHIYSSKKQNLTPGLLKLVLNFLKFIKFKDYGVEIKDQVSDIWFKLSLDIILWSLDLQNHHNMRGISNVEEPKREDEEDDDDEDNINILTLPKPLKLELQKIEDKIEESLKDVNYTEELSKDTGFEEFLRELETLGTSHFTSYYPEIRLNFTNLYNFTLFPSLITSKVELKLKFDLISIWFNFSQNNFSKFSNKLAKFKDQCELCITELSSIIAKELEAGDDKVNKDDLALWYEQLGHLYLLQINFLEPKEDETEDDLETQILQFFVKSSENFEKSLEFKENPKLMQFLEQNSL
ncbi:hypothetical protein CONCODRAFT_80690 [Conidiobolus coronatus NRRL 28638]|uniref:Uncharacterized protein n=1 Tax=Conidiobolus coronatus (strain ATCC 28846 / CBS 209.66 / NRRL 28638) TaxID=796925 RepID=A0A137NST7_CONC2|nr:hypothetical protein CONCODRAFT_80690 [Conidiobolus coronatus NRRL 28638]|eukprot:KXN65770.1 hypothetical protein CONCODRAFT_80690 [Conidiobolus coronatus NRRL 28638]